MRTIGRVLGVLEIDVDTGRGHGVVVNAVALEQVAPAVLVAATVAQAPVSLLQFHGDETPQQCAEAAAAVN